MGKLQDIYDGWKNVIWKNPKVEQMAKSRAVMCAPCPSNWYNICKECNCPIPMKTRAPKVICELKRWK